MRFLVTAGNTREKIDDVRDWGNIFTGNTGYSIARAMLALGEVDLITSNRAHLAEIAQLPAGRIHGTAFRSHEELKLAIQTSLAANRYDAVFMTAAVADYRPAGGFQIIRRDTGTGGEEGEETWVVRSVQAGKIKGSYEQIAILGQRTEKLVDQFRTKWGFTGLLVKFKLEVGIDAQQLIEIGQTSRRASKADYLVANTLEMVEGPRAGAYLLSDAGAEWVDRADLARRLVEVVKAACKP